MSRSTDLRELRRRVQQATGEQIAAASRALDPIGPGLAPRVAAVSGQLAGGQGRRASFLYWGHRAAGTPDSTELARLAASMEFFQGAALLHDDVMDRSDTRRGMPSAHRAAAALHGQRGWAGDPERFGEGTAILAGNLCLTWCDQLYATCGLPAADLARGRALFDRMRTQLMGGQFLDLLESARGWEGVDLEGRIESARTVIRYKSAKYTIEQPLLIGALVGGVPEPALPHLSSYGLALGEAFQLRDDVLGVFGDPEATGKPAGDDLREGKRTVLIAYALDGAQPGDRQTLEARLGRDDIDTAGVDDLRDIVKRSRAVERVESLIEVRVTEARAALARASVAGRLDEPAVDMLEELVSVSTERRS
ncbi:MAG: polyprenyl synthetase family protein [Intrasporangium sp.]|uniref:polyprenyl synthetase family protein n=1 Tax=Intrasporangium sp. TaxID=1925024 RepID=UPI002648D93B|nr:polyprenyl synthetase family protein [Intrasporangium sp.]MDN5795134.1 polyprenyl synthetase family protein [Intrasporangium sp.]